MKNTTLCYIERDGKYLLMHRVKKEQDENAGQWIGVGGHCEEGESPEDCLVREVREETGLVLTRFRARGLVTFISDVWGTQYMHLFTADGFTGTLRETCGEGVLAWVDKADMLRLPHWRGDEIFLRLLAQNAPYFSLKLVYEGDALRAAALDGQPLLHF